MKFLASASSIPLCLLLLAGCDSLGIHDMTRKDQVPDDVKAQHLIVQTAPPTDADTPWPRLGDVPRKPYDFTPKPVYDHYMDEMEYDRDVAQEEKKKVETSEPPASPAFPSENSLTPPLFQKE